jgi:hypothetical protein
MEKLNATLPQAYIVNITSPVYVQYQWGDSVQEYGNNTNYSVCAYDIVCHQLQTCCYLICLLIFIFCVIVMMTST